MINLSQAFAQWQELAADIPQDDRDMFAQAWNDYTDSLTKDGELCALQYHYAPSFDEDMPGSGSTYDALSDDRDFILAEMGVTLDAKFVPFSQSRHKDEKQPSLNWRMTLKLHDRDVVETDYMQGCGHCPAYQASVKLLGHEHCIDRDAAIRRECETGKRWDHAGRKIQPPSLADVLYSLLQDARVIDYRDFSDWASEYGFDDDSITTRRIYEECIATATKLRAAFGGQTVEQLQEMFQDY